MHHIRTVSFAAAIAVMGLVSLAAGCNQTSHADNAVSQASHASSSSTSNSTMAMSPSGPSPIEPNPSVTPGAVLPVSTADVCTPGYSHKVRDVPEKVKQQAYAEYGITHHQPGEYEVDHLISLELGGSNSIKNLWPQSYKTQPWNAHIKDQLENALHADVCSGKIDMPTAQQEIATDWISAYKREFHTQVALPDGSGRRRTRRAKGQREERSRTSVQTISKEIPSGKGQVWVNLKSDKYFYSGSRYYGNTSRGRYMSERDAEKAGYVAAGGQGHSEDH